MPHPAKSGVPQFKLYFALIIGVQNIHQPFTTLTDALGITVIATYIVELGNFIRLSAVNIPFLVSRRNLSQKTAIPPLRFI
jgi:hypothetical protein